MTFIFEIAVLIFSVIIHEVAHGLVAYKMGDSTAKHAGRLSLNPIKHVDMFGSILVPAMTLLLGGVVFGWAKPVPVNLYNIRNRRLGEFLVSLAGPASNIIVAIIMGLLIRVLFSINGEVTMFMSVISYIIVINLNLAIFNLLPIPPLDGSKIVSAIIGRSFQVFERGMDTFGVVVLILLVTYVWKYIYPVIPIVLKLLTGISY